MFLQTTCKAVKFSLGPVNKQHLLSIVPAILLLFKESTDHALIKPVNCGIHHCSMYSATWKAVQLRLVYLQHLLSVNSICNPAIIICLPSSLYHNPPLQLHVSWSLSCDSDQCLGYALMWQLISDWTSSQLFWWKAVIKWRTINMQLSSLRVSSLPHSFNTFLHFLLCETRGRWRKSRHQTWL